MYYMYRNFEPSQSEQSEKTGHLKSLVTLGFCMVEGVKLWSGRVGEVRIFKRRLRSVSGQRDAKKWRNVSGLFVAVHGVN
jgi:hypothetical protein